jgi:ribosomal protein S6E (S10)
VQQQSDGALFWKISGGNSRQGMPAFSFLPEPQRWQLVLHIRASAS